MKIFYEIRKYFKVFREYWLGIFQQKYIYPNSTNHSLRYWFLIIISIETRPPLGSQRNLGAGTRPSRVARVPRTPLGSQRNLGAGTRPSRVARVPRTPLGSQRNLGAGTRPSLVASAECSFADALQVVSKAETVRLIISSASPQYKTWFLNWCKDWC